MELDDKSVVETQRARNLSACICTRLEVLQFLSRVGCREARPFHATEDIVSPD